MTASQGDILIYHGERVLIAADPLGTYLDSMARTPVFVPPSAGCCRGYYATWEIKDKALFLTGLAAFLEGHLKVGLEYLFPGEKEVFAAWYSGEIRLRRGKMLKFIHLDDSSVFEEDLFLKICRGCLAGKRMVDNRNNGVAPGEDNAWITDIYTRRGHPG